MLSKKFSVSQHVDRLLVACAQSLFALRTLRTHGLPSAALQMVFQAIVVNMLTYASPAWWGLTTAADRNRLEAFLKRSAKLGFRPINAPTLASICSAADDRLFQRIISNSQHLLHQLLPPKHDTQYSLRERVHDLTLPTRTTVLNNNNFIVRMLYKEFHYFNSVE